VYGEHIANQLRGLQDNYTATLTLYYMGKIFKKKMGGGLLKKEPTLSTFAVNNPLAWLQHFEAVPHTSLTLGKTSILCPVPQTCSASWIGSNLISAGGIQELYFPINKY
jgi:hypothetical protein